MASQESVNALRKELARLEQEQASLRKVISFKQGRAEALRKEHEEKRPRRPVRQRAQAGKQEKTLLDIQAVSMERLEKELAMLEAQNKGLKEQHAAATADDYLEHIQGAVAEQEEELGALYEERAALRARIEELERGEEHDVKPLPDTETARGQLSTLCLQYSHAANRLEYLRAFMGELGREFAFLDPLVKCTMSSEDADACMQAIEAHVPGTVEGERAEQADVFAATIYRLLCAAHRARNIYVTCSRLQQSLTQTYAELLKQMGELEQGLTESSEEAKIALKAQEELKRLTDRAQAIRKYAEEYQKYSSELMAIN